jgi:hypothetical protein
MTLWQHLIGLGSLLFRFFFLSISPTCELGAGNFPRGLDLGLEWVWREVIILGFQLILASYILRLFNFRFIWRVHGLSDGNLGFKDSQRIQHMSTFHSLIKSHINKVRSVCRRICQR